MMSLWDALRMNMMISYQELVRTFLRFYRLGCDVYLIFQDLLLHDSGNDSNLLIVFYVQIMPDDFVMQLHRF